MARREYTVTEVNNYIKNLISSDYVLSNILVKGEVSNCKYHSAGHIYFSLKDERSSVSCVMFRGKVSRGLDFRLEDGQEVVVGGTFGLYDVTGSIQIYAERILLSENKEGKLFAEYNKLKERLSEEGLFDFEHKKPIPKFPKRVGIVTAVTGAAIHDIESVAKRRNPYVELILYPAKVQGEGAADTIIKGIEVLDKMGLDTIIIGRGGGSIEDLWAFNDERLARVIFAAETPIISGTGHDVDNTIADYVADLRAPTPSAAAELAIPDVMTHIRKAENLKEVLGSRMDSILREYSLKLRNYSLKLERLSPERSIYDKQQYLADMTDRLHLSMKDVMQKYNHRLELDITKLHGLSPTAKLVGGFGYVADTSGNPIRNVKDAKKGDRLTVTMHDGSVDTEVI